MYGKMSNHLAQYDRLSMAHGVEVRVPFVSEKIIDFCFSLPTSSKVNNQTNKLILRDSLNSLLPKGIKNRKKKIGFSSPMNSWFESKLKKFLH